MVLCSPSYCIEAGLKEKVKSIGKIIRAICILDHPIPKTKDAPAC
jgi:Rab GDP dissociation inhibitor